MNKENLWIESEHSTEYYVSEPFDEKMLEEIEMELGYKLPKSYVELMREHNGGRLKRCFFKLDEDSYVKLTGMYGIGREKTYSLCGSYGSKFWIEEWEYPDIGVAICDCPSAGHEKIFLDYRECGREGEPRVVHIDQELDYEITILANTFEEFVNGLCTEEEIEI